MIEIRLICNQEKLTPAEKPIIASGDVNSVQLRVEFCQVWDKYAKSAIFFTDKDPSPIECPMLQNTCHVPAEVLAESGTFYVGIRGVNANDTTAAVLTTDILGYRVVNGAPTGVEIGPTPDVYQQILTNYGKMDATKQNKLGWVTDADIEAMFAGTYEGVEEEDPEGDGYTETVVTYAPQDPTEAQKAQARRNIGAASAADIPDNSPKAQFKNIRFGFIGDSQTERNYHKTKIWAEQFTDYIGSTNLRAYSGASIAFNAANSYNSVIAGAYYMSKAVDVVLVMAGINDVWFNTPLGEFGGVDVDGLTFYGALDHMCSTLVGRFPKKQIVFITPIEQNNASCTAANTTGLTATDFSKAMKEVCAKYAIPVYDANAVSGIYPLNKEQAAAYTTDGLHLNDAGQERLGKQMAAFLQNNCCLVAHGKFFDVIGEAISAYYSDNCLSVDFTDSEVHYGAVPLPGVVKMSIDMSVYKEPLTNYCNSSMGWFGFKQADGTYEAVAPASNKIIGGVKDLTGEAWTFDANGMNPANQRTKLWAAPSAMPSKIEIVLEGATAKMYFDATEVYSTSCIELAYVASTSYTEMDGVTFTYAE